MTPLQVIVLAIVQGITEFAPVSSSAHLILVPYFLQWPDQGLTFDIATHVGTLLATVSYFRRDVRDLVVGFFTGRAAYTGPDQAEYSSRRLSWWIALGTLPAGIFGLLIKDWVETGARSALLIAGTSIGYGLLLAFADRKGEKVREIGEFGWREALIVGAAQALALVPGTSRSGITITAALLLGFSRPAAARFSFLLAIPIMVVASAVKLKDFLEAGLPPASELLMLALGIVVSAVTGYLVIAGLLTWLRRQSLDVFVVYRIALGLVILATVYFRG
ncbi:MAG TPA: undecaprenyl-diphosphate phosphatase [Thermoanaerobaculia bacterium]|nr:undecaprenyl-diphosphate phosphatase [Thermoanaerobaculia bacterium]